MNAKATCASFPAHFCFHEHPRSLSQSSPCCFRKHPRSLSQAAQLFSAVASTPFISLRAFAVAFSLSDLWAATEDFVGLRSRLLIDLLLLLLLLLLLSCSHYLPLAIGAVLAVASGDVGAAD